MAGEEFKIDIEGNALAEMRKLTKSYDDLLGKVDRLDDTVKEGFDKMDRAAKQANESMSVLVFDVLGQSADILGRPFREGADLVYEYDSALRELEAITGVTGDKLDMIGDSARDASVEFGIGAADQLQAYQLMLSKLDPALANKPEALSEMGRNVAMLSKTMKGDAVGAVTALNNSLNQYGVDLSDATEVARVHTEMTNQLAAAAKIGSMEVPDLADAVGKSGAVAKLAGVEYSELAASIEVAGKFFETGAQTGTAMRNVMLRLQRGEFLTADVLEGLESAGVNIDVITDKSLSLADRLRELRKASGNQALLAKMFGDENTVGAAGLLENIDLIDEYHQKILDLPNAAADMADILGESYAESKSRIDAFFNDIKLGIFSMTGDALPMLDVLGSGLGGIIEMAPGVMAISKAFRVLAASEKIASFWTAITTSSVWSLTAALLANPITWVVAGLAALTAGVIYAWENMEGFRKAIYGIWEATKVVFGNIADFIGDMLDPFFKAVDYIIEGEWGKAARELGMGLLNVATSPFQMIGEAVTGGLTEGVADAYTKGEEAGRKAFQEDQAGAEGGTAQGGAAAAPASQPQMVPSVDPAVAEKQNDKSGGAGAAKGGGGRIITVHINQLVGKIENHVSSGVDMSRIREEVKRALIGGVRDFELSGT